MIVKSPRTPAGAPPRRQPPGNGVGQPGARLETAAVETLLRQFIDGLNAANEGPDVRELQGRVSAHAQSYSPEAAQAFEQRYAPPRTTLDERLQEFESYFHDDAASSRQEAFGGDWRRLEREPDGQAPEALHAPDYAWMERRLDDLKALIENSAHSAGDAALHRRLDEVNRRLEALHQTALGPENPGIHILDRQIAGIAKQLDEAKAGGETRAAGISAQLARLSQAADRTATAIEASALRTEKAVAGGAASMTAAAEAAVEKAAEKSSRRTFELTARHFTEALKQTSPVARFAAIESEVRALNHHSRETGQRAARALEDVQMTLREFLEQVAPARAEFAYAAGGARPAIMTPVHQPGPRASDRGERSGRGGVRTDEGESEQENSRILTAGLIAAAIILLMASAGMLYLNLTGKKPLGAAAPAAKTGLMAPPAIAPAPGALQGKVIAASMIPWLAAVEPEPAQPSAEAAPKGLSHLAALAARDHAPSQYRLAAHYQSGALAPKNLALAKVWYGRAAAQGHVHSMHNLGSLSAARGAAEPDYPAAMAWFAKAAAHGLADSQFNLAALLERDGGAANLAEAYRWYAIAGASGDAEAEAKRASLQSRLSRPQLRAAERLIAAWKALPENPAARAAAPSA